MNLQKKSGRIILSVCLVLALLSGGFLVFREPSIKRQIRAFEGKLEQPSCSNTAYVSCFDGRNARERSYEQNDVIGKLCELFLDSHYSRAYDWSPEDITYPVYGFAFKAYEEQTSAKSGGAMGVVENVGRTERWAGFWSNGYLVTSDGSVWSSDIEMGKAMALYGSIYTYSSPSETNSMDVFLLSRLMWNGNWDTQRMSSLSERSLDPEYIYPKKNALGSDLTTSLYQEDDMLHVCIKNASDCEWTFNSQPILLVEIDDEWYIVPSFEHSRGYNKIHPRIEVEEGQTAKVEWSLYPYGNLPDGKYALLYNGFFVGEINSRYNTALCMLEFTISENGSEWSTTIGESWD